MAKQKPRRNGVSTAHAIDSARPLSASLSQILVAFTVEFDSEFERQMSEGCHPGGRLSLVVWANLIRSIPEGGISVRGLTNQALADAQQVRFELGCLERWKIVTLRDGSAARAADLALRDGWGSGRGISGGWIVRLTSRGTIAKERWPSLFEAIERRWVRRFGGEEIRELRESLLAIVSGLEMELPHGLVNLWERKHEFPPRVTRDSSLLPLPTLLSQALLAFAMEFERESDTSLALCANALRVLSEKPIPERDIPVLTGSSPETSGIGWQLKPYIVVEADPAARRGKVVRLSSRGLAAQKNYYRLTAEIEKRWETRFGKAEIQALREALEALLRAEQGDRLLLAEGLVPPRGTVRAGDTAPALGRRDLGAAAKQRARDLVAQSERFVRDPAGALPHYPLWDMNRGFGP